MYSIPNANNLLFMGEKDEKINFTFQNNFQLLMKYTSKLLTKHKHQVIK